MILKEAIDEIALYQHREPADLRRVYDKIAKRYDGHNKWSFETAREFDDQNIDIRDSEQLKNFYATTDNYIHELMEYHATEAKAKMRQRCIAIMKQHNVRSVLDYGCGIGQDSIEAAGAGLTAVACDLPSKTLEFAKWRFKQRKLPIATIDLASNDALLESYDAITCFEVVMHTTDPIATVKYLYNHVKNGGLFFLSARFKGYSLALGFNRKYDGKFDGIVQSIGFNKILQEHMWGPTDARGKYLYVYQKHA